MHANYLVMFAVAMVQHVPPHWILGYSWQEMGAIVTIIIAIAGAISWIVNLAIVKPAARTNMGLQNSLDNLTNELKDMRESSARTHQELDRRIDKQELHLAHHDEEIKTLFSKEGENHEEFYQQD
ncbi:hypothetical protein [Levilactobacillus namurensis]|uniref:hypothetical protein n=1 Tax=Levilactobacillus namurensis TaxID=380393 RepID=UPI0026F2F08B|nr:hypothetical protein [Levilactobacillus namurensis]